MKVLDREGDINYNTYSEQGVLAASKSGTVTIAVTTKTQVGVEISVGAGANVVLKASQEIDAQASTSVTASISNKITITVPPLSTGHGNYGVSMQVTSGHLYTNRCGGKDYGEVISYAPLFSGWCTWVAGLNDITRAFAKTNVQTCPETPV